ncbi:hypothetical protein Psed_6759 (plasmid) [Pseudonocardia dioxanivorans CB1190]|uniref:Uncharacterized protein n=1 Tax=Pseudonocardia dioxanivorans (strain ATCC 55486 / DSM 44775 / JCM 13855 / CB1190) TaxID=675635 RepID=F2L6W8_PSEUX|nr:hypothetical protein [Pseudonocardia dioxanivorans]AEA28840.1 hypothetical protein Psed_6759 [Pseudonocardia dioxanivorans CB1190]GJF01468.1 hypothetical protein PSD17_04320 [Pseudonocardia sp. D17]
MKITRKFAVIAAAVAIASGAAVVVATSASASPGGRDDDGFSLWCTPIRPGDTDAGFFCTPTDDRGRQWYGNGGGRQAPRPPVAPPVQPTVPPQATPPAPPVTTTVAPPVTTTAAPPTTRRSTVARTTAPAAGAESLVAPVG